MKYWILALPRKQMEHCIGIGTFGLNRKYVLGRMDVGDRIACYVHKEYKLIALGEVSKPYYVDEKKIFPGDGPFANRIQFKAQKLSDDSEIDFIQLLDKMSFIKNMAYWSVHFNASVKEISKKDWDIITAAAGV